MKLSKKHIGKLFDNHGADGSWAYQLVDIRAGWLLFNVVGDSLRYEAEPNTYADWRVFKPQQPMKGEIEEAWASARKTP